MDLYVERDDICFCENCMTKGSRADYLDKEAAQWVLTGIEIMEQIANRYKPVVPS